jgi:transcriptional regulator with XRE-family HTH domain
MSVGEMIVMLRTKLGMTQTEFAERTKISRSVMNRIELGTRPVRDDELILIADFFGVTTDYLLGRTDISNPVQTIAAHRTDNATDDLPPEALQSIEDFKKFVRAKYKNN